MKKISALALCVILYAGQANATACSSLWGWAVGSCPDYTASGGNLTSVQPQTANDGTYTYVKVSPESLTSAGLSECVVAGDTDHQCLAAITIQKIKALQIQIDALGVAASTFNYPSRALNSCYQISGTKDADFHYKVDVSSGTLLSGTATGTVTATSYTNSGCTTGSQIIADGAASQGAALGILSVSQIASVSIDGTLSAGKWIKITTANTAGTPSFVIRSVQSEKIYP